MDLPKHVAFGQASFFEGSNIHVRISRRNNHRYGTLLLFALDLSSDKKTI